MKYRVRNIKTWELYDKDVFLGRDGNFYNRVFECIGGADRYLVEPCLFTDKNGKEVYVNDVVILEEEGIEYRVYLPYNTRIILEDSAGKERFFDNKAEDFVLKEV